MDLLGLLPRLCSRAVRPTALTWNSRIGTYTLDQAILDFWSAGQTGPVERRPAGCRMDFPLFNRNRLRVGTGVYGYPGGVQFVQTTGPGIYEDKLRLTFTTNNVLMVGRELTLNLFPFKLLRGPLHVATVCLKRPYYGPAAPISVGTSRSSPRCNVGSLLSKRPFATMFSGN